MSFLRAGIRWPAFLSSISKNSLQEWLLYLLLVIIAAPVLALLPLPLAVGLVGGSILLVLALIDPIWALYAAVLAVPIQELILLPGGISFVQAALLLCAGSLALHVCAHPERPVFLGRVFIGLLTLLWALLLSSSFTPYSQTAAFTETLRWTTVLLVYLLACNSAASGRYAHLKAAGLVACLLLAPASNAVLGLWQFVTGTGPPSFGIAGGFVRAYGTIGKPNSFAGYINMGWPLAVAVTLGAAWASRMWLLPGMAAPRRMGIPVLLTLLGAGTAALLLLAALLASFSRGAWVGAVGGAGAMLIALAVLLRHTMQHRIWQVGGAVVAAGVLLLVVWNAGLFPDSITRRVNSITNNLRLFDVRTVDVTPANFAVVERMAQMQAAWAMFGDHPLTGVGPGNYTQAYEGIVSIGAAHTPPYALHPWYTSRGHAHNYYLHIAAEAGIIGLLAYLLLLILLLMQVYLALIRVKGWFWGSIVVGGCGIIASIATHGLFENLHVLNMGVQLGAVWGLLGAVEHRMKDGG